MGNVTEGKKSDLSINQDVIWDPMDSFMIGRCNEQNDTTWPLCSDGCNLRKLGSTCKNKNCSKYKSKFITIVCDGETERPEASTSCKGIDI